MEHDIFLRVFRLSEDSQEGINELIVKAKEKFLIFWDVLGNSQNYLALNIFGRILEPFRGFQKCLRALMGFSGAP